MENQILDDMIDSDIQFRAQFDRSSPTFHKGDPTPAPTGEKRVPTGAEEFPTTESPVTVTEFGEEYKQTEQLRTQLGNLKQSLTALLVPFDGLVQLKRNNAPVETFVEEAGKFAKQLEGVESYKLVFPKGTEFQKEEVIQDIISKSSNFNLTKEEQFEWNQRIKNVTSAIFRDQKVLLERMKAIKKKANK
jgi:hypothetical protein